MKLPALALFERALRLETRSAVMCWARIGLLAIILVILLPIQAMARSGWYGAPGLRFLQEMVWVNLVFITLAGLSYFASAITEEKEEMMLGLLRMTNLNPVAILLGKSTSRLIGALLLLLVQVPFVLLAVTLGGVAYDVVKRDSLVGNPIERVDLRLSKTFTLKDRIRFVPMVEAFNLFNRVWFGPPNTVDTTAANNTFGQITTQLNQPRLLQLALRLRF